MNQELIFQELEHLRRPDGTWDPADVVEYAKSHPRSESHKHFNWNVNEAAQAYWLQQARYLITKIVAIRVDPQEPTTPMRVFFREGKAEAGEERAAGSVLTKDMLSDPVERLKVIRTTLTRALGILNSYPLPELQPLIKLANKLLAKYRQGELVTK